MGFYCVTLASNFGVHLNNLWIFYKRLCQNHSFQWPSKNTSLLSDNDFSIERKQEFNELLKCAHLLSIDLMLQGEHYLNITVWVQNPVLFININPHCFKFVMEQRIKPFTVKNCCHCCCFCSSGSFGGPPPSSAINTNEGWFFVVVVLF